MASDCEHKDRQKAFEIHAFNPILNILGIDISCVNLHGESPDIRFDYSNKHIGLEVVDCYPKNFDIITEKSINKLYHDIEKTLSAKGLTGDYRLCFKETIYSATIKSIKKTLILEVEEIIKGGNIPATSYIESLDKCRMTLYTDRLKIHPCEQYMRMIQTPPLEDILRCVNEKNRLLTKYKELNPNIDEFWLLIYIPTNINYYSTKGIAPLENITTGYKRIYVSDWLLNGRLIYELS